MMTVTIMKKTLKTRVEVFKNMGGNIPGGDFLGGNFPFGNFPGGSLIGGSFLDTVKKHYCNIAMTSFIITNLSKLVLEVLYCSHITHVPCSFDI